MSDDNPLTSSVDLHEVLEALSGIPRQDTILDSLTAAQQRDLGHRLLELDFYEEAEACLLAASKLARLEANTHLHSEIKIDIARSLKYRNPRRALGILRSIRLSNVGLSYVSISYNLSGLILQEYCQWSLSQKLFHGCVEVSLQNNDKLVSSYAKANQAHNVYQYGNCEDALRLLDSSYGYLIDSGDPVSAGLTKVNIAYYNMLQNNLDGANLHIESISDIMRQATRNLRLMAHFALNVAELELLNGEFAKAASLLQTAERYASQAPLLAICHRSRVWQRALRDGPSVAGLEEIRVAAMDLRHRFLSWDANVLGLLGLVYSERLNLPYDVRELITDDFYDVLEFGMLRRHFGRILDVLDRHPPTLPTQPFPKFLSRSPAILRAKEGLKKLVDTDVRLLLEGESGTGKTFLARQLHEAGKHRNGPFITVDCTNLEESLFESKLFGHLRGSFTGAVSDTIGLVEQANGGTLFLDEIGELPTEIQGKLLYTIEEQRYRPVGAKSERHSDFRVIAATNRDIDAMLLNGTLRSDLFFRMAGFRVHLPPLRSRREDIVPLAEYKLAQLNANYARRKHLRAEVWEGLVLYNWPGNVRELSTALERGYHLSSGRRISLDDLGLGLSTNSLDRSDLSWYAIRRDHLLKVLRLTRGNVTRAAHLLGLNRTTLIYKLKLLNIARNDYDIRYANATGSALSGVSNLDQEVSR